VANFRKLNETLSDFINKQQVFFVATAGREGSVNVSPKGMDTLKIIDDNHILWLNLTGSGNETATHVSENGRMTLMFCAFEGDALILRTYGQAEVIHPRNALWKEHIGDFRTMAGSRQLFIQTIDRVQTSCGSGVPYMDFKQSRGEDELEPYFEKLGEEGVTKFWKKSNTTSLDGNPTGIFEDA